MEPIAGVPSAVLGRTMASMRRHLLLLSFALSSACRMQPPGEEEAPPAAKKGAEAVIVSAKFDFDGCPAAQPFRVEVKNGSDQPVKRLEYRLSLMARDTSDDLMSPSDAERVWNTAVAPNATASECQSVPAMKTTEAIPAEKMPTVRAERKKVYFR